MHRCTILEKLILNASACINEQESGERRIYRMVHTEQSYNFFVLFWNKLLSKCNLQLQPSIGAVEANNQALFILVRECFLLFNGCKRLFNQ